MLSSSLMHANQDFPTRSQRTKSTTKSLLIPSAVANPISHEPLRRTGSFAAATITAVLAIWVTTSSNGLQFLLLSLSYVIHQTLRSSRWSTVHRKQLYQRSLAHPALHAPSLPPSPPPSRAPLPPSHRPRTTRHPPPSATRNLMISNEIRQQAWPHRELNGKMPIMLLGCNSSNKHRQSRDTKSSSEARRHRRWRQNSPRHRRRRRRGCRFRYPATTDRRHRNAANRRTPAVIAASSPFLPLPRRCRHHRQLSQWSWLPQRSRRPTDRPRASLRKFASWSVVAKTTKNPLFLTAPLEGRGFKGR